MYFTREVQTSPEQTETHPTRGGATVAEQTEAYDHGPERSVGNGIKLWRSPALSSSSNTRLRVVALSRAQRTHGNRFTQQLVSHFQLSSNGSRVVQRECGCGTCAKCSAPTENFAALDAAPVSPRFIQAQAADDAATPPATLDTRELIPSDIGHPLDEATRTDMEQRLGADFRDVRVHSDAAAATSATTFGANAFTTGRDIYFGAGKYAPGSPEGRRLLAHELTHVMQQSAGQQPSQGEATANGEILVGAADDHLEKEADARADAVTQREPLTTSVTPETSGAIQRDTWEWGDNPIVNTVSAGASAGVDLVAAGVKKGADVVKKGAQWAISQIEKLAPGAVAFFRNIRDYFKNAINKGVDGLFGGMLASIREKGLGATLADMVGSFAAGALQAVGGFIAGQCAAMGQLAEYLLEMQIKLGSGILELVKKGFNAVKDKLDQLWTEYGAPGLEWVTKKLAAIWKDVDETASKIWSLLKPLRDLASDIWDAVTDYLAEGRRTWNAWKEGFVNAALDKWEEVKAKIKPYMGYVKTAAKVIAGVVVLLSPAGPFVVIGLVIYGLYQGVKYLWDRWGKGFTKSVREWWANEGLPTVQNKLKEFRAKVDAVKSKVSAVLTQLYDVFIQILGALGVLTFLSTVKGIFDSVTQKIREFKDKLDQKLDEWAQKIKTLIARADPYIQQMKEVFRQSLLIMVFGPYAIMDDGVWHTIKTFVALAMKTPCLKELGGLFRVPGIVQRIDGFRANVKAMWKVIQNPDPLIEEIKNAIGPMIAKIEPEVRQRVFSRSAAPATATTGGNASLAKSPTAAPATAAAAAPAPELTPEQLKALEAQREEQERKQLAADLAASGIVSEREAYISLSIWHYLSDSLLELAQNWWPELKKIAGDLIWPWPAVEKDFSPMLDRFGNAIDKVFELEMSDAIDEFLKGMKLFNSIAGALSGWFMLASVLIGAVLGALGFVTGPGGFATVGAGAAAGLEVAEAVGMGLLVIALSTEAAVLEKADFDLKYQNLRITDEAKRNEADQQDCKDIAGSLVSIVTLGALFLLADIAAKFAKWVYSLVENVPIVKSISTLLKDVKKTVGDFSLADQPGGKRGGPVEIGPEGGARPRDVTGEPVKTGEPAKAGERERLTDDAGANAERKGVPREKLEVEVRELNQKAGNPDNVRRPNDPRFDAEMDAQGHTFDREKANKSWCRASDGPACGLDLGGDLNGKVDSALKEKPAEPSKPVEEAPPTEGKSGEAPKEVTEPVDPKRAQLESDLAAAKAKKTAAETKANELRKQAQHHEARAKELDRQAAIAKGEARARLRDEVNKAREAAKEASKAADALFEDVVDAQLDIQKKTAQLNTDARSQLPCFAAGTLVWTSSGPRAIDELKPGDQVLAYDFASQATIARQVLELHKNRTMRFYHINVEGATIRSTSLHPFWNAAAGEWVEARHLVPGMKLQLLSGEPALIESIDVQEAPFADTFNLRVAENFTYFVGAGVLVHNGGPSYGFGNLRIYAGTNPKFPGKVYIGQTDDIVRRQGEHQAEAIENLKKPDLTPEQREFWEFKKDMVLEERVSGLNPDQANYLEQKNMDLERAADNDLMNRREQVSRKNISDLEKKIAADPKVQEAGLCQ